MGHIIDGLSIDIIQNDFNIVLERYDKSEVDYNNYYMPFNRNDFEFFSIYRVITK